MSNPVQLPAQHAHAVPVRQRPHVMPGPVHALPPPAMQARLKRRHRALVRSFFLLVVCPVLLSVWYLNSRAADQFTSSVGFAVRTEESQSGLDLLGGIPGLSALSGSSSSDTDILYEFLFSQALVSAVDTQLDLATLWSRPTDDPVFAYDPSGSIEDLTHYWQRMVRVSYDPGTGLIELRAHAFLPDDAQAIAAAVLDESSAMINRLSAIARNDTMSYADTELTRALDRLKTARTALTQFRSETRIVDPMADLQGEMGVLNNLQQQLTEEMIALDMLRSTVASLGNNNSRRNQANDVRINQAALRVDVIRARIAEERQKFGGGDGRDYSALLGEFERLTVDVEFAEAAYVSALATFESARAEAQRQSRYLAAYVTPTLSERALYPQRALLVAMVALFLTLGWAVLVLILYNLRDRR